MDFSERLSLYREGGMLTDEDIKDIENLEDYISENDKLMIPIYRKELRDYGKQTD